ncbi:MAG: adenylyl-sulfate kinase [Bacteroidales bacterium]|nr:adenylyl-sulfate kinase [Bacteroidales bacterium]
MSKNIFPEKDRFLSRSDKETLLKQKGLVVWFTGLSGAGKSTLALALERNLHKQGLLTQILDGDKIRNGLNKNLGFTAEDRNENIRRIAEVGKLFSDCGLITISAFISPTHAIRSMAREIIGDDNFFEIYVSTPIEVCEQRDPKGLYQLAHNGIIKDFTGVSAPYEPPQDADLIIDTSKLSVKESTKLITDTILPKVKILIT